MHIGSLPYRGKQGRDLLHLMEFRHDVRLVLCLPLFFCGLPKTTFVSFILYSLPYADFSPKVEFIVLRIQKAL